MRRSSGRRVVSRLAGYLRCEWRGLAAGLGCALLTGPIPLGVGRMISGFFESGTLDPATGDTRWDLDRATLVCVGAAGLYSLLFVLRYGQGWFLARTTQRVGAALRRDIYAHLLGMSLTYYHRKRTGALMSTLTSDVQRLQGAAMLLKDGVSQPVVAAFILGRLIFLSPTMTLFALVVVPAMGLAIQRISRRLRSVSKDVQDRAGELNALMDETLSAPRVVQSFGAVDREQARFARENDRVLRATLRGVKRTALLGPTVDWIGAMAVAFTLYAGSRSGIAAGTFVEFVFLSSQLANAVGALGNVRGAFEEMLGAADRVFSEVLDVESEIQDAPGAVEMPEPAGRIVFDNVHFAYEPGEPVLAGIDFVVEPGTTVALVGATGAGKSTLADLVPRFHDPTSGMVSIDGLDVRAATIASLRRRIALVPQRTVLFTGSIAENIAYGRPDASSEEIEAAARAANAHEFISAKPAGYATPVGERGETLSGGQAQRIAIARALLADPRILILDEATSALDAATERLVQDALARLMRGRTTLVIAHRLSTIADADRIVVLDRGRVVETGTWGELLAAGGTFAALVRARKTAEDPVDA